MIQVRNLSCQLGAVPVLRDVSFSIEEGSYTVLVGPNGAGKTTLLRCILGLNTFEGQVELHGLSVRTMSRKAIARQVAYVPQAVGRMPAYSVREFLALSRYPYQSFFPRMTLADHTCLDQVMQRTGISTFENRNINTLSGGERQKVFLAAALCQDASYILLDEPSVFLDPSHEDEIYSLLSDIHRREKRTILLVTHDLNRAALHAERVLGLSHGQLLFDGAPVDLMSPEVLARLYDSAFLLVPHPEAGVSMALPRSRQL